MEDEELTNILFAPDWKTIFTGRAVNGSPFMCEVYVHYTFYRVVGPNTKTLVLTLQGESDEAQYSPQCLVEHIGFWEVTARHSQRLLGALTRPLTLRSIKLSSGGDEIGRMPSKVMVQASEDGVAWQPVDSVSAGSWHADETKQLPVSCSKPFRHYRFDFEVPDPSKVLRLYGLDLSFAETEVDRVVTTRP